MGKPKNFCRDCKHRRKTLFEEPRCAKYRYWDEVEGVFCCSLASLARTECYGSEFEPKPQKPRRWWQFWRSK